jgi:hypothetical protein
LRIIRLTAVATLALTITTAAYAQGVSPNPTGSPTMPPQTTPPSAAAAPSNTGPGFGSGVGKVWVDAKAKIYHCPAGPDYGKGAGAYMTEQAAKTSGNRPSGGRTCT